MNEPIVTISLAEYRDLIKKLARYELLEEQQKAEEEKMNKWREENMKGGDLK